MKKLKWGGTFLSVEAEQALSLVNRIEAGDGVAETELIQRYERSIKLILLKRTGNNQLASDLCQDTFVVALRKLRAGDLRKPGSLAAFIRQTAVNICIDYYRKEKRYVHQDDGTISLHHTHIDNKAKGIDDETTRALLETTLDQLAMERDREILRRFYLADEDKDRICDDLGLSSIHFDRVLYRAKQRMRELIDQQQSLKALLFGGLFDG